MKRPSLNGILDVLAAIFVATLLISAISLLTGCHDPYRYSYRAADPYWHQPLYPSGYGNHYRFTPQYDRVIYDQPMQYR